ncbi:hypothetical protein K470DRAFT_218286, partial [Piedraia hortae CBS 480.64]
SLIAVYGLETAQFDVTNAFLNATFPYTMFVRPPEGRKGEVYVLKSKRPSMG